MMTNRIQLNIGLDVFGSANTREERKEREGAALLFLDKFATVEASRTVLAEYENSAGENVTEETLIVDLTVADVSRFNDVVYVLSEKLVQDCISLYDETVDAGELIGPKATLWGNWNREYFVFI